MKKNGLKDVGFYAIVVLILLGALFFLTSSNRQQPPTYREVLRLFEQQKVDQFIVENNVLTLFLKEQDPETGKGKAVTHTLFSVDYFRQDVGEILSQQGETLSDYNYLPISEPPWWLMAVPYILIVVVFFLMFYFMFNRGAGGDNKAMKFGRARTKLGSDERKKVTFNDVAGADEEKEELKEIVDFLRQPRKYIEIGARIPKGVLLVGPPGTGKTLIAKAVAGEAGVQFLSISGSDFVELYVGVGASRVRDLFDQAKKISPSIIFIDEIDAVGRRRGAGLGGGHDEREQTLNQLLVEMDGFGNNEGVIVIAATNRPDILDPALLRPGRFDRQVFVGMPDIRGREAILKVHAHGKPLDRDVNLSNLAKTTPGFTGADLENLLNEAALLAARRGKKVIGNPDLEDAMLKVIAGPEKKSKVVTEKERKLTAYHEAGHAVVMRQLETQDPVHHITIIPRGMAGGMTISLPKEDKSYASKSEMVEDIVSYMGGRVAEKLVLDDISTGASNDIERATKLARSMVVKYGMSDKLGPINYGSEHDEVFLGRDLAQTRTYSENMAALIDEEIAAFINNAYRRCEEILTKYLPVLHKIAEYLLEHETMDGETFKGYFEGEPA